MATRTEDAIPAFDRHFLSGTETFTRIGDGEIGGKAAGLELIRERILPRLEPAAHLGISVVVPTLTILTTRVFDAFLEHNGLREIAHSDLTDDRIAHAFQGASMPAEFVGDLRALTLEVRQPLAVRSSSLLEDALDHPFAGVYGTKMIPNNASDVDTRFRRLVQAVKFVYASTFFREARDYIRSVGQAHDAEKMAVVIQEVLGQRMGARFYPTVSAVARSYNYYPTGNARPHDGVVDLALGLGKQIVDGGRSWCYAPPYPKAPPPYNDIGDLLKSTQTEFWAVNMGPPPLYDPVRETEYLSRSGLRDAENDGVLRFLVSTYDPRSDRLRTGLMRGGARALTFAPLLSGSKVPLNDAIKQLLEVAEDAVGAPVEMELALNLDHARGVPARLGVVQVRPMKVSVESVGVASEELDAPGVVLSSTQVLGNGTLSDICDVVYVRPDTFDARHTRRMAMDIERINRRLTGEGRPYLLIGFGRWGSSDPWLGVPVNWSQISGARVIVEATLPRINPDLSQGSHFFHNLISFQVLYMSVAHRCQPSIDWQWLDDIPALEETDHVRHVRLTDPLEIRVDGSGGRGVVKRHLERSEEG
jgi:hypothetical protein